MKDIKPEWLVYEGEDTAEELKRCDERFKRSSAVAAAAAFVIAAVSAAAGLFSPDLDELLARGDYGEGSREIVLDLGMDIGGRRYHEDADILIREKDLSEADAYHLFDRCVESLPAELAQRFGDGHAVSSDMDLPSEWNYVAISWRSEDPEIVSDDGQLLLPLPAEAVSARFSVFMHAGGWIEEGQIDIPLDPFAADPGLVAEKVAAGLSEDLSADSRGNVLELPADYRGVALEWKSPGVRFPTVVIPLLLLAVLALYFSKYDALKRECAKRRSAFEASVPDLSLRLVLFLNAGLVVSSALDELIVQTENDPSPLFRKMREIKRRCDASNSGFEAAFSEYAASTGNRDLTRIATMIFENSGRGSELASKLEAERSRHWYERLNAAKARAGEAETKLCLPLMLLLIVLVIIAAAPALMNM